MSSKRPELTEAFELALGGLLIEHNINLDDDAWIALLECLGRPPHRQAQLEW